MLFNSYIFVFLFLPVTIFGYFGINKLNRPNLAQFFLLCMSLWFYGYFNPSYLAIIIASVLINFAAYKAFGTKLLIESLTLRKAVMILVVAINIGILLYFKYFDFFIENLNTAFRLDMPLRNILLPLGISFFTFQQISFVVDAYKGEVPKYSFLYYASFVTYFPQLIAGPIVTHDELVPQFIDIKRKHFNWDNFTPGIYMFSMGLVKKVLIADTFANAISAANRVIEPLDSTNTIIVAISYMLQIYFDFSGYSDMAIGLGKMMNIDIPLNFDSPYKALTVSEFWKRWHRTLTRFFTKYVYIPLGGNRRGAVRTYINIMIVFTLSGFWHGAEWSFVLWGILHGIHLCVNRAFKGFFDKLHPALNWIIAQSYICFAWIFFSAENIEEALEKIKVILRLDFGPIKADIANELRLTEFDSVFNRITENPNVPGFLFFVAVLFIVLGTKNSYERMKEYTLGLKTAIITIVLLIWGVMSFSGVTTFIYWNF